MCSWLAKPLPALALLSVVICGCAGEGAASKPTAHLTGTVTINNQSIPPDADAMIDFFPHGGSGQAHPTSANIENGNYDAPNVPQGKVMVRFNISRFTGRMITEDGGSPFRQKEDLVPVSAQQGIEIEVTEDTQKDFHL